jgi:hypothetical protein
MTAGSGSLLADISAGPAFLAIPLITLQAVVEVAVGGFIALFITDLTRQVTRGFLASTGVVLLLIGVVGVLGELNLPDPSHLTDHPVDRYWLLPSSRTSVAFLVLFAVYLGAVYLRPAVLHTAVGALAAAAGLAAIVTAALTYPTPLWGGYATVASFVFSALVIGTVTTAMLLGHWYLVVPNLSTRPLFILLGLLVFSLLAQVALDAASLLQLSGHGTVAEVRDVLTGGLSVPFWVHVGAGLALPLVIAGLTVQSTRLRSLMSATGLLYVAVVLTLIGQVTAKVVLYSTNLPL